MLLNRSFAGVMMSTATIDAAVLGGEYAASELREFTVRSRALPLA